MWQSSFSTFLPKHSSFSKHVNKTAYVSSTILSISYASGYFITFYYSRLKDDRIVYSVFTSPSPSTQLLTHSQTRMPQEALVISLNIPCTLTVLGSLYLFSTISNPPSFFLSNFLLFQSTATCPLKEGSHLQYLL